MKEMKELFTAHTIQTYEYFLLKFDFWVSIFNGNCSCEFESSLNVSKSRPKKLCCWTNKKIRPMLIPYFRNFFRVLQLLLFGFALVDCRSWTFFTGPLSFLFQAHYFFHLRNLSYLWNWCSKYRRIFVFSNIFWKVGFRSSYIVAQKWKSMKSILP